MAFDKKQLKLVIYNTLIKYSAIEPRIYSKIAYKLVCGTIARESLWGTYLYQDSKRFTYETHGLGIGQCEMPTFDWLKGLYGKKFGFSESVYMDLITDLDLAILICRLRYFANSKPLPRDDHPLILGKYWDEVYNGNPRYGTPEEFVETYNKYVK